MRGGRSGKLGFRNGIWDCNIFSYMEEMVKGRD